MATARIAPTGGDPPVGAWVELAASGVAATTVGVASPGRGVALGDARRAGLACGDAVRVVADARGAGEVAPWLFVPSGALDPPPPAGGWVRVGVGEGDGDEVAHTPATDSAGGDGCEEPSLPVPQLHPSMSPLPTADEAAPVLDQTQPVPPSPCQYPQKSG